MTTSVNTTRTVKRSSVMICWRSSGAHATTRADVKPTTAPKKIVPQTSDPSKCGSIAQFPTKDKCWQKNAEVTKAEELCDKDYGRIKLKTVSYDRFTGAECNCNEKARGDGYNCQSACSQQEADALKCSAHHSFCDKRSDGKPMCGCEFGYLLNTTTGKCQLWPNACDTCQFNCHVASKCLNTPDDENELSVFSCDSCNTELGFTGRGVNCRNIDECLETKFLHKCDKDHATCVNKNPLTDNFMKYDCVCNKGWHGEGTTCRPCEDDNECVITPGICGPNSVCENTEGSYICTCEKGYVKDSNGTCIDDNECERNPCFKFSTCKNTPGSYVCECNVGFIKEKGICIPDEAYFCKHCDKNSTECKLTAARDAYTCECLKCNIRVNEQTCKPETFCDKAQFRDQKCASDAVATCTDEPDGCGFSCACKPDYEGDGKTCTPRSICNRDRPCSMVTNTVCKDDEKDRNKYKCNCKPAHVRQKADEGDDTKPCYPIDGNLVNNCTLCDKKTEDCIADPPFKSCRCKDGFGPGPNGRCIDVNECAKASTNNCDPKCANCHNASPDIDGKKFICEVAVGWSGDGTLGTCIDIDECKNTTNNVCHGDNRVCINTVGSFKCDCLEGYQAIPGVDVCVDIDECARGNFTCNDFSQCKNKIGSYECVCSPGFKETGKDANGKPICVDINECVDGVGANPEIKACDATTQTCANQIGTYTCKCKDGYRMKEGSICVDIDECAEKRHNCDCASTECANTEGSYECQCKHGYEFVPGSNNTCRDINECISKEKPHKCNAHSSCNNLIGSYQCSCDEGYTVHPGSHPLRPTCTRELYCKKVVDMRWCGICLDIDTPPFYKCQCIAGSVSYNDTMCITSTYCDAEFPCPGKSQCKNGNCVCDRNYVWNNIKDPLTIEKIKTREPCSEVSWCEKFAGTCVHPAKCRDTGAGTGECYCTGGFHFDADLNQCLDINECLNATCPEHSNCHNYPGSYMCICDNGYANSAKGKDQQVKPVCTNINECALKADNCTKYANTKCHDEAPGFRCDCMEGFERSQGATVCNMTHCAPAECVDINECKSKPCDANAKCTNYEGSFGCRCDPGYLGDGFKCFEIDECDDGSADCDPVTEECSNLPGTYNCTCKAGFEFFPNGTCYNINECLSPEKNTCEKAGLVCVDTPGSYYCICADGYFKGEGDKCIDKNECTLLGNTACPQGLGDRCNNTDGDYNCICLGGFRKPRSCEKKPKTCECEDIPECKEGVMKGGKPSLPCGKNAVCRELPGSYDCKCKFGMEGDPFKACNPVDVCKDFKCKANEMCETFNKAPTCKCVAGHIRIVDACIPNPCLKNHGGCGSGSICVVDEKTGKAGCNCPSGKILDDTKSCVEENVCKCEGNNLKCSPSPVCTDPVQTCYKVGTKPKCVCPAGYELNDKTGKCDDINECLKNPCPAGSNCTNVPGSFICACPRGQIYYNETCQADVLCSLEGGCHGDPHASCKHVDKEHTYCVCNEGYTGTGRPSDPQCRTIDPCEVKEEKEGKKPCEDNNEFPMAVGKDCVCKCNTGFERNETTGKCDNIDECKTNQFFCKKTYACKDTIGSYACVCPEFYKENAAKDKCDPVNKCSPNPCNATIEDCDWRNGKCSCKNGFRLAANKTCIDINECEEGTYNCGPNTVCLNTIGSYECPCREGYKLEGEKCVDIDECVEKPNACPKNSTCKNEPGTYRCDCHEGTIQHTRFDCLTEYKNETVCNICDKYASCLHGMNGVYNCSCADGFIGDGRNCTDIDECATGMNNCHKLANCTNTKPYYTCTCIPPYEGDGKNVCELPPLCSRGEYNDCPKDADCKALTAADSNGKWVSCVCKNPGYRFNDKTRQCEDINECTEGTPCPKEANCTNTEGSFKCICPAGFQYDSKANKCVDIDECKTGEWQVKCTHGKCANTVGSWNCSCELGYKNEPTDSQICIKDKFCGVKDECCKNTTTCVDNPIGYRCDCLKGLKHIPGSLHKCEDQNECKDGSHTCAMDGSERCTNTYQGFACNCTNGFARDDPKKKCLPENKCSAEDAKKLNCGAYSLCVNVKNAKGVEEPKCICETGYYRASDADVCVVVPPCLNDFDCPSNSHCAVVQAQNGTKDTGTYHCECSSGYVMKGHQCFPVEPCKEQKDICGKGVCEPRLVNPFYECVCLSGQKQDNSTASCEKTTCATNNPCSPNAKCIDKEDGGVYCQCEKGMRGIGLISSPCTVVNICKENTPCSRFATCTSKPKGEYSCACNAGYAGNGTWCKDVDECGDASLNNCDPERATCSNIQGGFICTCKAGFTGKGTKGECTDVNECKDPKSNQCDVISTSCNNTIGSYACACKEGYEKSTSDFACVDKNECLNATTCGIHKCANLPGTFECLCLLGYENPAGDKKTCIDINECKKNPCVPFADCTNTIGSFNCTCKEGYEGDGNKLCNIYDKCKNSTLNKCDPETTTCQMLPDKPDYNCVCGAGYQKISGMANICIDIDECADEGTPYDRETTACKNLPGSYKLECKPLYAASFKSDDGKNITCVDLDECKQDPAFQESLDKIAKGTNNGTWDQWMVPPKLNSSGYSVCYNLAKSGTLFSLKAAGTLLPFCKNLAPKQFSNYTYIDSRLQGFECTCVPPTVRKDSYVVGKQRAECPNPACPVCLTEYNYECVDQQCRCKHGYTERRIGEMSQCIQRECGAGEALPAVLKGKKEAWVQCLNERYVAKQGFEIIRDNKTSVLLDVRDIDECLDPGACCNADASKNCTGAYCARCSNIDGGYNCAPTSGTVCNRADIDRNTCMCPAIGCSKQTAWFFGCDGASIPATVDATKQVCARMIDNDGAALVTYKSMKDLLEDAASKRCTCCFDVTPGNTDMTLNPVFNYYGPCQNSDSIDKVVCEGGAKAIPSPDFPSVAICPERVKTLPEGFKVGESLVPSSKVANCKKNELFFLSNGEIGGLHGGN